MTKIALVRGHHLSKEETISYEPLRDEFDFTCFSTDNPWFDHSEIEFPIERVPSAERFFQFLPAHLGNKLFGAMDNMLGTGQWMRGLPRRLRGFDLVHTSDYCHLFTYQAARAKREGGYKLVAIHYDNIPFSRDGKPLVGYTKQVIFRGVDAFFAMSERARQSLLLEGIDAQKIFVIGNAIDVEKFRPRLQENISWRQRYGIRQNDIVVLFIGRVRASKGVFELVYATKKLLQDRDIDASTLRVVIIGRGPGENELRKRINQLGLEKHVLLAGAVPHSDIHLAHNMADIFVLPSVPRKYWQEQFGIVLIESMACGKPVVSTLSGSIPDVVGEAGILVQPNDHFALYLGLKKLLLDKDLRTDYGVRARERVEQCFAQSVIASKIRNAYHQVLARGN